MLQFVNINILGRRRVVREEKSCEKMLQVPMTPVLDQRMLNFRGVGVSLSLHYRETVFRQVSQGNMSPAKFDRW